MYILFKSNYEDLTGKIFGDLKVISQAESNFSVRGDNGKIREERKWKCECICGKEYIAFEKNLKNGKTLDCGCKIHRDRIGMKFGKLTILGYEFIKSRTKYRCKCECGNETTVYFNELSTGRTISCGCSKSSYKNSNTHDLTGLKFGKLKVLSISENKKNGNRMWLCECECGNKIEVKGSSLNSGTKSCGCLSVDKTIERSKKYNSYEYKDDYIIIRDDKDNEIFLDIEDFDNYDYKNKYITLAKTGKYPVYKENGRWIRIHREIMGLDAYDNETVVDHINRNRADNRRFNLRITDITGNAQNSGIQKNNTSGIIGVGWHKRYGKWYASIGIDNKNIHLGSFDNKEDAIISRLKAESKYYGREFSPQRDLFEKYNIR